MKPGWYHFSQLPHNRLSHAGLPLFFFFTRWVISKITLLAQYLRTLQALAMTFVVSFPQSTNSDLSFLLQQSYVSSGHQMAPPSPNTNSSSNNSGGGGEQLSKTNLYIRGLHPGTTDQDLVKLCQPWVTFELFHLFPCCSILYKKMYTILSPFCPICDEIVQHFKEM